MFLHDTIIAIATGPASGAIGILRLSGPSSLALVKRSFCSSQSSAASAACDFLPRTFFHGRLFSLEHELLDEVMVVFFPAPHSFTGEDVVEIHAHGGMAHLRHLLQGLLSNAHQLSLALRVADPGEFTRRAYLNGKLDLTQAEAIHGLIIAESDLAVRGHLSNLGGHLRKIITDLRSSLIACLSQVEAGFEFPDEDIQTFSLERIRSCVSQIESSLLQLRGCFQLSRLSDNSVRIAIIGRPNVGKSSLLNAILSQDRAIVSDIPGTTRDFVEGSLQLGGVKFTFIDTAGVREAEGPIEALGISRSHQLFADSDAVIFLTDCPTENVHVEVNSLFSSQHAENKILYVLNKYDLHAPLHSLDSLHPHFDSVISTYTRFGIDTLLEKVSSMYSVQNNVHNYVHINERQMDIILKSMSCVSYIKDYLRSPNVSDELLAADLRHLSDTLAEMTGAVTKDQVLDEIFSKFCIGK